MTEATSRAYYVAHNGRKFGPLSLAELASRRLSTGMLVWTEGRPDWVPIVDVPELRQYVHHAAAATLVAPPSRPSGPPMPVGAMPPAGTTPGFPPPPPGPAALPLDGRLKFLAITTLSMAALGLLVCPLSLVGNFFVPHVGLIAAAFGTTAYLTVWTVFYSIFFLTSIAMLVAGIGLLRKRRWAALTSTVASITCLVVYFFAAVFQTVFVLLPIMSRMNADDEPAALLIAGGLNGVAVAMLVGFAWHIASLMMVNSATIRARLR